MTERSTSSSGELSRAVGVPGAILMGLGSILGTGVFVSIGVVAGVAPHSLVLAVVLAAVVATFNGLSSAQLAASHPVSGGTYEYGYRYLGAAPGFAAGWMFLCAKSASAATAALGFAGYLLSALGGEGAAIRVGVALAVVAGLTAVVAGGIHRSSRANAVIVGITLASLVGFILAGAPAVVAAAAEGRLPLVGAGGEGAPALLHATALMFVAYTGYGRIATLGEEVRDPRRSIPRAIVATLALSAALYASVACVAVAAVGGDTLAEVTRGGAAPLQYVAGHVAGPFTVWLVQVGAMTAMLGVLVNLLLGLSRVVLAMARRGDLPTRFAEVRPGGSPAAAVVLVGVLVAGLSSLGSVKATWSFSAFTVLVYYALTNLAALRLPPEDRRFPRWTAFLGLASCLALAFWVEPRAWAAGLLLLAVGLGARRALRGAAA